MPPQTDCLYCTRSQELRDAMIEVVEWDESIVYLSLDNRYPGRCIVAHKTHVRELFELSDEARDRFMADVSRVARAVRDGFKADKIHLAVYGDLVSHLHFHVVPKRQDGRDWGVPFIANPVDKTLLEKIEAQRCLEVLRGQLTYPPNPLPHIAPPRFAGTPVLGKGEVEGAG